MNERTSDPAAPARRVLAVVTDLFFGTRIAETARGLGIELRACRPDRALETARATGPALAIVDLTAAGDPAAAIAALRGDPATAGVPVVAFYPHVETALRDRAVAAGATHVMPRSAFNARLAALLREGPVGTPGAG